MESNHHGLLSEVTGGGVENAPPSGLFVMMLFCNGRRKEGPPGSHRAARRAHPVRAGLTQQGGRRGTLGFAMLSRGASDVPRWDPCIKCPHASLLGRDRD